MHFVHLIDSVETFNSHPLDDVINASDYLGYADYAVIGVFFDREVGGNVDNEFIASLNA